MNCAICIACIWLVAMVENVNPMTRLLAMNRPSASR